MKTELLLLNQPDNYFERRNLENRKLNIERYNMQQYYNYSNENMKGKGKDEYYSDWKKWKWEG